MAVKNITYLLGAGASANALPLIKANKLAKSDCSEPLNPIQADPLNLIETDPCYPLQIDPLITFSSN